MVYAKLEQTPPEMIEVNLKVYFSQSKQNEIDKKCVFLFILEYYLSVSTAQKMKFPIKVARVVNLKLAFTD